MGKSFDYLSKKVYVKNGAPYVAIPENNVLRALNYVLRKGTKSGIFISVVQDIVDNAANFATYYEELAASAQKVLESVVLGVIEDNYRQFGRQNYALAGGVFSNVVLNQKIAESGLVKNVYIYPNMGDGGLAVGAVYNQLSDLNSLSETSNYEFNPYLGNKLAIEKEDVSIAPELKITTIESVDQLCHETVGKLLDNKIIGLVQGKMEFGPRALMNRSILATPTDVSINQALNHRLNRTEFMPFAPVVRVENFEEVFDVDRIKDLRSFKYMTMTCRVRDKYRNVIPAVVHVDGTARPQVVSREDNEIAWKLLKAYEEKSGIPCLVNTSFNVHEEPIVCNLNDALGALKWKRVDVVVTENKLFENLS
jgi:carbamoyltransferase